MDHYQILEIPPTASAEDIKNAYRRLALRFHPDHNQDAAAEEKFKRIADAYAVLGDMVQRSLYDAKKKPQRPQNKKQPPRERPKTDPNLGKHHKPQAPTHDIWGRELTEAERRQWLIDNDVDLDDMYWYSDFDDLVKQKKYEGSIRRKQAERDFYRQMNQTYEGDFKDSMADQYESNFTPKIRH